MRRLLPFLAALLLATPAAAQPPLWVVRDKDSEVLIFGSVHLLPPGLDWRPKALSDALRRADDVWFELPPTAETAAEIGRGVLDRGMLPPGQALSALLPAADAARLARVARASGLDLASLDRFEPWMAEFLLAGAAAARAGGVNAEGVEAQIAAATPTTAQQRAFETAAEQLEILDGAPMADQLASLRDSLRELEEDPDAYGRLVRLWMAGDTAAIDAQIVQSVRRVSPAIFQRLVQDRNARWAAKLDARLKGRGRTVVIVGVGHLVGAGSLPHRLRALGYSVQGP